MRIIIDNSNLKYSKLFYRWLLMSIRRWMHSCVDKRQVMKIDLSMYNTALSRTDILKVIYLIIESLEVLYEERFVILQISPKKKYKGIPLVSISNFIAYGCLGSSKYNLLGNMFNFVTLNITKLNKVYKKTHGMR